MADRVARGIQTKRREVQRLEALVKSGVVPHNVRICRECLSAARAALDEGERRQATFLARGKHQMAAWIGKANAKRRQRVRDLEEALGG